ncbi:MAG: hypothetical protein H6862_01725 [Rhodospirillales bacterium]|nr:hypothetical protein [Rhodospirillales bacterium]
MTAQVEIAKSEVFNFHSDVRPFGRAPWDAPKPTQTPEDQRFNVNSNVRPFGQSPWDAPAPKSA